MLLYLLPFLGDDSTCSHKTGTPICLPILPPCLKAARDRSIVRAGGQAFPNGLVGAVITIYDVPDLKHTDQVAITATPSVPIPLRTRSCVRSLR